jgi:hypothetical protein
MCVSHVHICLVSEKDEKNTETVEDGNLVRDKKKEKKRVQGYVRTVKIGGRRGRGCRGAVDVVGLLRGLGY